MAQSAYYFQLQDAYDVWDQLAEYSWRGLYDALENMRGGRSHLDENLLISLEDVVDDFFYTNDRFPTTPQELFDFFNNNTPQYVSY